MFNGGKTENHGSVDPVNQLVAVDEKGKSLTSTGFAQRLDNWIVQGKTVDLVIGGADGLHESLSPMRTN